MVDGVNMTHSVPLRLVQVPPPPSAPVDAEGERLGLVRGLRAETYPRQYRCGQCDRMQHSGSICVQVPDHVRKNDPAWAVEEACRVSAFNGSFTGWCLSCAPKAANRKPGLLRRLLGM